MAAKKVWVQRVGTTWHLNKSQGLYPEVEHWSEEEFRKFLFDRPDVEPVMIFVEPDDKD